MALASNILALIFSILGSFCTASGLICMKIGNIRAENNGRAKYYYRHEWLLGVFILGCG